MIDLDDSFPKAGEEAVQFGKQESRKAGRGPPSLVFFPLLSCFPDRDYPFDKPN
jgi:hypothetical protein